MESLNIGETISLGQNSTIDEKNTVNSLGLISKHSIIIQMLQSVSKNLKHAVGDRFINRSIKRYCKK